MRGDRAYRGRADGVREHAPDAVDFTNRRYRFKNRIDELQRAKNRIKSKVRAKVEHMFGMVKRVFGFTMVRYRGLDKNANRLFATLSRQSVNRQNAFEAHQWLRRHSKRSGDTLHRLEKAQEIHSLANDYRARM